MNNLYERIERLCRERGFGVYKMCDDLGISKGVFSNLKANENRSLSSKTLTMVSNYLNLPIETLLGEKEKDEKNNAVFDDFTYAIYNETKDLPEEDKKQLLRMARFFREQLDKEK